MAPPSPSRVNKRPPTMRSSGGDLYLRRPSSLINRASDESIESTPAKNKRRPQDIRTGGSPSAPFRPTAPALIHRNDSESDPLNRGQVEINAAHARLENIIAAQHAELAARLSNGEGSAQAAVLTQHLLHSPPPSPAKLAESPKSAREQERKESLQKLQFNKLIDDDNKFCDAMKTVTGIKEWWSFAKVEWHKMRDELRKVEKSIENLKRQRKDLLSEKGQVEQLNAQQVFKIPTTQGKLNRYSKQTESLEKDRQEILQWLTERRGLFKQVWNAFCLNNIGGTPPETVSSWSTSGTSRASSTQFSPQRSRVHDIDKGPNKDKRRELYSITDEAYLEALKSGADLYEMYEWVVNALEEMQAHRDIIKTEYEEVVEEQGVRRQLTENWKYEITKNSEKSAAMTRQAEYQMRAIRAERPADEASQQLAIIQARHVSLNTEIQKRKADQAEFYTSRDREFELSVQRLSTEARLKTLDVIIKLLTYIKEAFERNSKVEAGTLENMYKMCQVQYTRRLEGASKIRTMLNEFDLPQSKRTQIIQRLEQHYKWAGIPEDKNEKIVRTLRSRGINSRDPDRPDRQRIYKILKNLKIEKKRFGRAVEDIRRIYEGPTPNIGVPTFRNEIPDFSTNLPPIPTLRDLENLLTLDPQTNFGWGTNSLTAAEAKAILEVRPHLKRDKKGNAIQEEYCWGDLFTQTFTSPDIGQAFVDPSHSWSLQSFTRLLNSFLATPMPEREVQAFLIYTTHINELFHRGFFTKRISPLPQSGWETWVENPIRGLPRKEQPEVKSLSKLLRRVEDVFKDKRSEFFTPDRVITKTVLLKKINHYLPGKYAIFSDDLDALLAYWQLRGKFFIEPTAGDDEQADKVVQVDNGWEIGGPVLYPAVNHRPRGCQAIHEFVKSVDITGMMGFPNSIREEKLYEFVYLRGGASMNWDVSRGRFHLYLRYMSEREEHFRLRRNGEVSVLSKHWEKTFHPERRNSGGSQYTLFPGADGR